MRLERAALALALAALGFTAVLFLLKAAVALVPPEGLLRDDFLYPLWARWEPASSPGWLLAAAAVFLLGAAAWRSSLVFRLGEPAFAVLAPVFAVALWTSLGLSNGGWPEGLVWPIGKGADYLVNTGRFASLGELWREYDERQAELSLHARTHPAGAVALLFVLESGLGGLGGRSAVAAAVVAIGALTLLPLGWWARAVLHRDAARAACLLWILTPGVLLYGATCLDMVFALPLVAAAALFVRARAGPEASGRWLATAALRAALLGCLLTAAALLTFSTAVLVLALALLAPGAGNGRRGRAVLELALAAALCAFLLLVVCPATGFDWWRSLLTAMRLDGLEAPALLSPSYYLLTRLMGALDFLLLAGVAVAPLWLQRIAGRERLALAPAAALAAFLLAGVYKIGETGRIGLFLLPFVVIPVTARLWDREDEETYADAEGRRAMGLLLTIGFVQALVMEALLDTRW